MENNKFKIGIILDSTQDNKLGHQVASWIIEFINEDKETIYEVIDLKEYHLSLVDNSGDLMGSARWKSKAERLDAAIFITQEYNFYGSASLKNALLITEENWYKKVAGIISYGASDGARAVEYLKDIMAKLKMTSVRMEVALSIFNDFSKGEVFKPRIDQEKNLATLLDQVNAWGKAALALR